MLNLDTDALTITDVGHLPIVKHYAKKINLVDTIDAMVPNQMHTSAVSVRGTAPWHSERSRGQRSAARAYRGQYCGSSLR